MIALLGLLACSSPDPELVAQREAIAAWKQGVAALEQGSPDEARRHFVAAREHRPKDGLLLAWEAKALADAGDLEGAIASVRQGLEWQPAMAEARYDLACWLARSGALEEAAVELRRALDQEARPVREAAADPDFAPHLDHPAFAFLPRAPLEGDLSVPDGAVFWGSQATVSLTVGGSASARVRGDLSGPVDLVSAVADRHGEGTDGTLELVWTLVVRGAGPVAIGPLQVTDGDRTVVVPEQRFEAVAPPDKPVVEARVLPLATPEGLAEGLELPGAASDRGALRIRSTPAQRVQLDPRKGREQRFEQRLDGRAEWIVRRWVELPAGTYAVEVSDPGRSVLKREIEVSAGTAPPG